ncbi:hypothetical protein DM860_009403 [Cuscuta australis]|uniref:Protein LAZ1 n=1 Tax=Cuscuta australis TaxID=267555 RepID=A0A328DBX2_9ASTE|nr:hypothetical protein DM860_009403 [Cuscuta australis]
MRWLISIVPSSSEHWTLDWVKRSLLSSYSPPLWATLIGGFFTLLSLALSVHLLLEHLSAYKNPEEQKFLIGVILMVPCYAIESFVSLVNPAISVYFEILRDGYESFAMYCFGRYLVACLGGEERTLEFMEREGQTGSKVPLLEEDGHERGIVKHPFPFNFFLKPWKLDRWVYEVIKFGIVQYMIIKAFTAILAVILEAFHVYGEGQFKWNCGYPYLAVVLNFIQMGIASVVHLYVFPAKPYQLMGERFSGAVSVLGDYLSADCPIDPEEVRDSERPTKLRLPHPDVKGTGNMTIRESVRDVVMGAGEHIVKDVKFTVTHAVEPMEKGFTKFNEKLHKISQTMKHDKGRRAKDDSCVATTTPSSSSQTPRVIRGIDDPLLNGSVSDSGTTPSRKKKQRRKSGYTSESGGDSSGDCTYGGFQIRGRRWVTKD